MGWFRSLGRRETYEGIRRRDTPLVPDHALREAVVNAVMHRDYAITGSQIQEVLYEDAHAPHAARLRGRQAQPLVDELETAGRFSRAATPRYSVRT